MFGFKHCTLAKDTLVQQIDSALLSCAVGDALGAGIENWSLEDIIRNFVEASKVEYIRQERPNKPKTNGDPGDVTDDTSMALCVMAALTKAMNELLENDNLSAIDTEAFFQHSLSHMFQAFLFWAKSQKTYSGISGEPCAQFNTDQNWPHLSAFHNTFGAGDSTIRILIQGKMGTLEQLPEKIPVNNKPERSKYAEGCGAMMRVMPIGLLCAKLSTLDVFDIGCRSGAITHGDPASYLAAGITAEIITDLIREKQPLSKIVESIKTRLIRRKELARTPEEQIGYDMCLHAITTAITALNEHGVYPPDIMDTLGKKCGEKLFTTPPVLAQSLFVALAAERHDYDMDKALKLAVVQSGDSDSVGAIAGSFLGVMFGDRKLPSDKFIAGLNKEHVQALKAIGEEFKSALKRLTEKMVKTPIEQPANETSSYTRVHF